MAIMMGCNDMSFVAVAKFPCKLGQAQAMEDLFHSALADTRYLQWRTDTGIADALAPIVEGGWDGILASVYRLGILKKI